MRRFRVQHFTTYQYEAPVKRSRNLCLQLPRELPYQKVNREELRIHPDPESRLMLGDGLGNRLCDFTITFEHKLFEVGVDLDVEVSARVWNEGCQSRTQALELMRNLRVPDHMEAASYMYPSRHVQWDHRINEITEPLRLADYAPHQCGQLLMEKIHKEWKFKAGVTHLYTSVSDLLDTRHGVCQDFSHLMLGALRHLGFAARYVSGYIETLPKPGKPKLVGADVSHAWVQVYDPIAGWKDFDPTNNLIAAEQHITIAFGRDFSDISPLRGLVSGGGSQSMRVSVDVAALE